MDKLTIPRWEKVRISLRSTDTKTVREAAVAVGKFEAESLPEDVGDSIIGLFHHPDPEVRAEAVRAIGIHWRLERALDEVIALLARESDWHVLISIMSALGALGRAHPDRRRAARRVLASAALNDRFDDFERMLAYRELLYVEGRIEPKEYRRPDPPLTEQLARFAEDRSWVEDLEHDRTKP